MLNGGTPVLVPRPSWRQDIKRYTDLLTANSHYVCTVSSTRLITNHVDSLLFERCLRCTSLGLIPRLRRVHLRHLLSFTSLAFLLPFLPSLRISCDSHGLNFRTAGVEQIAFVYTVHVWFLSPGYRIRPPLLKFL